MSKIAFLFPGQGAQKAGMGQDFYEKFSSAKEIFDQASQWLSLDMKELCFEKNDRLDLTEYTQAALVTTCLAMEKVVEEYGLHPDVTAGLSLGEYCAIAVSGGMSVKDAITTVRKRGILMEQAVPAGKGSMAAVLGLGASEIESTIRDTKAEIANYNCPGQIVISGETEQVKQAADKLKEAGAKRAVLLNVSGPFHSSLLTGAGEKLEAVLKELTIEKPQIPYVANVDASYITEQADIMPRLVSQVSHSVRWQQSVEKMVENGVDTFIEIGPGRTLAGFNKKIAKAIGKELTTYNVATMEDIDKVVEALK